MVLTGYWGGWLVAGISEKHTLIGMEAVRGVWRSMRWRQWVKNLLVAAVPVLSGQILEAGVWGRTGLGFMAFSLIASGAYLLNDALDAEKDRLHPKKRHRPVAAGVVSMRTAVICGIGSVIGGLAVSLTAGWSFAIVAGAYAAHTFLYSYRLKHVPTVEMVALASGFVLRVVAGGVLVEETVSVWLFACVAGGALMMASGKRSAELVHGKESRAVLASYNEAYLTTVRSGALALAVVSYALWIFEGQLGGSVVAQISTLPYLTTILRYAQLAANGEAGEPEEIILHDRILQFNALAWVACMGIGVILG